MSRLRRIILFAVVGFVGLVCLVAAALFLVLDPDALKSRLESAASAASGMEVSIGGRMRIVFFPGLSVTLEDVHVRHRGVDVVSAKQARLGIEVRPLFFEREVRIRTIAIEQPTIAVRRDRDGRFNVETDAQTLPALEAPNVSVSGGTLAYADQQSGEAIEAGDCSLDVHRLQFSGGERSSLMKNLSFTAELACREVRGDGFTVSGLKASADAAHGVVDLKPVTASIFGTPGSGTIRADFSSAVPSYQVRYSVSQFPIEEFFRTLSAQKVGAGRMDFSASLSMQGKTGKQMRQTAKGQISLRGRNLTLSGTDLDQELARFESSQNFNLVDVGAFFFAGPLGLVVTKGYNFASISRGSGTSSEIRTLVSDWTVDHGIAHAQDVAIATKVNRIALQGRLDFVNDRFDDVTMALVDAKGCATVRQKIRGTFRNPVVEQPNLLKSLAGPALSLLKKGSELLGAKCDVFYAGSVAAP